jgi:GAF domain-containing protein
VIYLRIIFRSKSPPKRGKRAKDTSNQGTIQTNPEQAITGKQFHDAMLAEEVKRAKTFSLAAIPGHDCDGVMDNPGKKREQYVELHREISALFEGERDFLANAANCAALLWAALPDLNWAGVYFLRNGELVLGPFQGKIACVRIALNRGVCGAAASRQKTIMVPDVHAFPGHIACDGASRSEIVIPLVSGERLLGVLDLDSPTLGRFDDEDAWGLEETARLFLEASEVPPWI